jgi:rare lipoprotein A
LGELKIVGNTGREASFMAMRGLVGICFYALIAMGFAGAITDAPPVAAKLPPATADAAHGAAPKAAELRTVATPDAVQVGVASWYGPRFQGRRTATGARFDMHKLTAAHRTLPLGSKVRVTNLDNGKSVEVTINDRGPVPKSRVIDLSKRAALDIGITKRSGVAPVVVEPVVVAANEQ